MTIQLIKEKHNGGVAATSKIVTQPSSLSGRCRQSPPKPNEFIAPISTGHIPQPHLALAPWMPFGEWTEVSGSERLSGAQSDRLTCHMPILGDDRRELLPQGKPAGGRRRASVGSVSRRLVPRGC